MVTAIAVTRGVLFLMAVGRRIQSVPERMHDQISKFPLKIRK
jgi:hypothetical protein